MVEGELYGIAYNRKRVNIEEGGFTLAPDQTFLISGPASGPLTLKRLPLDGQLPEMVQTKKDWVIKSYKDGQVQYYQF